jgi:hypothetical protein
MAQLSTNNSAEQTGVSFNCDRLVTLVPTGTITILDGTGTVVATLSATAPEISIKEG